MNIKSDFVSFLVLQCFPCATQGKSFSSAGLSFLTWERKRSKLMISSATCEEPQRFTCPSHAATASQSEGAASGPQELRSSTHRTDSRWRCQGNWERGHGRWWRCAQSLHMGLGEESEREKREKGEGEKVSVPSSPDLQPYPFLGETEIGWEEGDHGEALACWVGFILFDRRCHSMI